MILAVDDDAEDLATVRRKLEGRYAGDYDIFCAESEEEAVKALAELDESGGDLVLVLAAQRLSGVSGTEKFAESQKGWVSSLQATLQKPLGFSGDRVTVLSEIGAADALATRENVTRTLTALKPRLTADDVLLVVVDGTGR